MFTQKTLESPTRIEVSKGGEWVATFTPRCYTVTLTGPKRTFGETFRQNGAAESVEVTHATWVRAAPGPVDDGLDERWLSHALAANRNNVPDALAIAMQYVKGASPVVLDDLQVAGDASYGPLDSHGRRQEGSDFNDYLGLRWLYAAESADSPEPHQMKCLDCSGYIRMIWGYRHHLPGAGYPDNLPLSRGPRGGLTLPRRAIQIYGDAPGMVLIPNAGIQVQDFYAMNVGDLVFFDGSDDDGAKLDHMGMYLGEDSNGSHRFISSRKTADGPTLADRGGTSVLDGHGYYAKRFRAVRRL